MQREVPRHYSDDSLLDDFPRHCRELLADLPSGPGNFKEILSKLLNRLKRDLDCRHVALGVHDPAGNVLNVMIQNGDFELRSEIPVLAASLGHVLGNGEVIQVDDTETATLFADLLDPMKLNGSRSFRVMPLSTKKMTFGALLLSSLSPDPFSNGDIRVLTYTAEAVSLLIDNAVMTRLFLSVATAALLIGTTASAAPAKPKAAATAAEAKAFVTKAEKDLADVHSALVSSLENVSKHRTYLEDEINSLNNFGEVVGKSGALCEVLEQVEIAAPSDATVLVLGETGTGKELIARAVHRLSSRRDGPFIKLNCAAIPTGLLESELLVTKRAPLQVRSARRLEGSNSRMRAHCSWTRSVKSRWTFSPNCSGYCRTRNLSDWAASKRSRSTCVWLQQPTAI